MFWKQSSKAKRIVGWEEPPVPYDPQKPLARLHQLYREQDAIRRQWDREQKGFWGYYIKPLMPLFWFIPICLFLITELGGFGIVIIIGILVEAVSRMRKEG